MVINDSLNLELPTEFKEFLAALKSNEVQQQMESNRLCVAWFADLDYSIQRSFVGPNTINFESPLFPFWRNHCYELESTYSRFYISPSQINKGNPEFDILERDSIEIWEESDVEAFFQHWQSKVEVDIRLSGGQHIDLSVLEDGVWHKCINLKYENGIELPALIFQFSELKSKQNQLSFHQKPCLIK